MSRTLNLLAFDLGASNGRAIVGKYDGRKIELQEVHKFANGPESIRQSQYWNVLQLFQEIRTGLLQAAKATNNDLTSVALDTWGVDYGLLDRQDCLISNPYHYRDKRTDDLLDEIYAKVPQETIYQNSGIQFMQINTLVQLYADRKYRPWVLDQAGALLFMPDLLNFFLTGRKYNEYTISSTSQLFHPGKSEWAKELFTALDLPEEMMQPLIYPGEVVGGISQDIRDQAGINYELPVMAVGSHDTASAVAAAPLIDSKKSIYISSGTWSLLGMELDGPVINSSSLQENFTNELGVGRTVRFLKNISGLWLIQECKRIWDRIGLDLSYAQISQQAEEAAPFICRINPDDPRFLSPDNMPEAIAEYCRDTNQRVPETPGEIARSIYESLAFSYQETLTKLEQLIGRRIETIHMVGGGIQAELLCQFTANATGRPVITGPIEATAMGNILAQLMAAEEIKDLQEGRELVKQSVVLKEYLPN